MKKSIALFALLTICISSFAQSIQHRMLVGGSGTKKLAIISKAGNVEWEHPITGECNDISMTKDGHVLFSNKKDAQIVSLENEVLWKFESIKGCEIQSASELPNGNILVMRNGTPAHLYEVTRKGKIKVDIMIPIVEKKSHSQFRNIRKTSEGTYLIPYISGGKVCEFNKDGALIHTIYVEGSNFLATRLKNGNTMVACGEKHRLVEFDKEGNEVWSVEENDLKGNTLFFVAGFYILENGNILLANWGGHGHKEEQAQIVEFTREKKVVGEYKDWSNLHAISQIDVLD